MTWETVIGLEVHVQLATRSKLFSGASTAYGAQPNTQVDKLDAAIPGTLPVVNEAAVHMAIRFGLSIGAEINLASQFARKNYFYPDLPKGYQISQFDEPIVGPGQLMIRVDEETKTVGITRAHLEEDAGKSMHEGFAGWSGIDLNRAGIPLLEIVSEPDLRSAKEAVAYLKKLHALVRYLGISDGNMQEGSFRCDANVSVRRPGGPLGTRSEIKNVNSFNFVAKAIEYEVARHIGILESGGQVVQETRLYDEVRNETRGLRSKEEARDYRYFPEPDLFPLYLDEKLIQTIAQDLPELPEAKLERFMSQYALSYYDAQILTQSQALADYFEQAQASVGDAKLVANWIMGELLANLNKHHLEIEQSPISPAHLAGLLKRIQDETISGKIAKSLFEMMWQEPQDADTLIASKGLKQVNNQDDLLRVIDEVLAGHPSHVTDYRAGKVKLFGFFIGQIMKVTQGKANPDQVNRLLKDRLESASS